MQAPFVGINWPLVVGVFCVGLLLSSRLSNELVPENKLKDGISILSGSSWLELLIDRDISDA